MNWLEVASLLLMPLAGLFIAWYLPRQLRDEQPDHERRVR